MKSVCSWLLLAGWIGALIPGITAEGSVCPNPMVWELEGGGRETLCYSEAEGAFLSIRCLKAKNCGALLLLRAAKKRTRAESAAELRGGKNPGSVACQRLGGSVTFAANESASQATLCMASDRSFVDCASLSR